MGEFFKSFIAECKRVVWPNKKDLITKTGNVIIFSLMVSLVIFGMDFLFSQGYSILQDLFVK